MARRPSLFNEKLAIEICSRISNGETLTAILKENEMPHISTILGWRTKEDYKVGDLTFGELYVLSREMQADYFADLINQDALDAEKDVIAAANNPEIDKRAISNLVQARRLKIDALKWTASKLKPQTYGEKLAVGGTDVPIKVNVVSYK